MPDIKVVTKIVSIVFYLIVGILLIGVLGPMVVNTLPFIASLFVVPVVAIIYGAIGYGLFKWISTK